MKPRRLQASRVEQGQVQAVPQPLLFQGVEQAHPLAGGLEAGRGHGVGDVQALQGGVHGRGLQAHALLVLGGVGIQGGISRPAAEHIRRGAEHALHGRMVWRNKGGQQLGQLGEAEALVKGEQAEGGRLLGQDAALLLQHKVHPSLLPFGALG